MSRVTCHVLQGHITVGYRGSFAIGRGDMSTTGFRKLTRILVCGKSALCREVFRVGTIIRSILKLIHKKHLTPVAGHTQWKPRPWSRSRWGQVRWFVHFFFFVQWALVWWACNETIQASVEVVVVYVVYTDNWLGEGDYRSLFLTTIKLMCRLSPVTPIAYNIVKLTLQLQSSQTLRRINRICLFSLPCKL